MGMYLEQLSGPALGIFQMEPATHQDIYYNYLKYQSQLRDLVFKACGINPIIANSMPDRDTLVYNLRYAACMARIQYLRIAQSLPAFNDIASQALYYKAYYNTSGGDATVNDYLSNYKKYVGDYYGQ